MKTEMPQVAATKPKEMMPKAYSHTKGIEGTYVPHTFEGEFLAVWSGVALPFIGTN